MKCDIVICVHDSAEHVRVCVESIYKHTRNPYRLIIIDDASNRTTQDYLAQLTLDIRFNIKHIRNDHRRGSTCAMNQGLLAADAPYVCVISPDTNVTAGWLSEMIRVAEMIPSMGIVTSSNAGEAHSAVFSGKTLKQREVVSCQGRAIETVHINDCALFTRPLINAIGVWDERFDPGCFDDLEYCRRAIRSGFKVMRAESSYVYCTRKRKPQWGTRERALWEKNKKRYEWMYGESENILYVITPNESNAISRISANIRRHLRNAHYVWVIYVRSPGSPEIDICHDQLKKILYAKPFFSLKVVLKIVIAQRHRFDHIYVPSKRIKKILHCLKIFHGASIRLTTNYNFMELENSLSS